MTPTPEGLLLVDKPAGMTSHDVVSRVRRLAGTRRVGHAGVIVTLGLLASALMFQLPIFILALVRLGVLTSATLRRNRRIGVALIVVFAAFLPTVDPISLAFEAIPLLILFEASIWASVFFEKRWHASGSLPTEPIAGTE